MNSSRTLWMGNIEKWMDEKYIKKNLTLINVFPNKLSILHKDNQKSCCFIELDSPQEALYVLDTYNGFQLDGFTLKLNWVNTKQKEKKIKEDQSIPKKYSVTIKKIIPPKILYYSINRYMLVTWIRT